MAKLVGLTPASSGAGDGVVTGGVVGPSSELPELLPLPQAATTNADIKTNSNLGMLHYSLRGTGDIKPFPTA